MANQTPKKGFSLSGFFQNIKEWFRKLGQWFCGIWHRIFPGKKHPETQEVPEATMLFTDVDKLRRADRSAPINLPEDQLEGKDKYPSSLFKPY